MTELMQDDTVLFKHFMDNSGFKRWLTDFAFALTYNPTRTNAGENTRHTE